MTLPALLLIAATAAPALEVRLIGGSRNETLTREDGVRLLNTRYTMGAGARFNLGGEAFRLGPLLNVLYVTRRNVEAHGGLFFEHTLWRKEQTQTFLGASAAVTLWNGINSDVGHPWGLVGGGEIGLVFDLGETLQLAVRGEALARVYFDGHPPVFFPMVSAGLRF